MGGRALMLVGLVGGCVSLGAPPVIEGPTGGHVVPIRFDMGGIEAIGTGQRIDFGRDRAGVVETMTRLQGRAPTELPCDASDRSALQWPDGPLLVFYNGAFAGWRIPDAAQSATGDTAFGQTCAPTG